MEYEFQFSNGIVGEDKIKPMFDQHGCVLVRNLFSDEEISHVMRSLESEPFRSNTYGIPDGEGRKAHINVWNQPGNDVTGMVARCEKVVSTCEALLGGEVYHYHSKLMGKPPREGGRHLWHQDYGYWYENGCLFPNMMTVFIAMDNCSKSNGCLRYLPGSQKCGRIEHHRLGGQFEADGERVEQVQATCPLQYAEMNPGDALFMHCNVLHSSGPNLSDQRRWALLCCYNRADNNPTREHHHPRYTPLSKVPDSAILACTKMIDSEGKSFMTPSQDKTSLLEKI